MINIPTAAITRQNTYTACRKKYENENNSIMHSTGIFAKFSVFDGKRNLAEKTPQVRRTAR